MTYLVTYVGPDTDVQLPGYLAAVPSIVSSGDSFLIPDDNVEELRGHPDTFEVGDQTDDAPVLDDEKPDAGDPDDALDEDDDPDTDENEDPLP